MCPLDLGSSRGSGLSPRYPGLPVAWVWRLTVTALALRPGCVWRCHLGNCIAIRVVETRGVGTLTQLTAGTGPALSASPPPPPPPPPPLPAMLYWAIAQLAASVAQPTPAGMALLIAVPLGTVPLPYHSPWHCTPFFSPYCGHI